MSIKKLEITAPVATEESLRKLSREFGAVSFRREETFEGGLALYSMLAPGEGRQSLIDKLYGILEMSDYARIVITPVDATIPAIETEGAVDTREELYQKLNAGASINQNYLILTVLSTLVALIGLIQDNVAVVIGAMVIAPLLGPNLAFAFGTSLGDKALMKQAAYTAFVGMAVALAIAAFTGWAWGGVPQSHELLARTEVGIAAVVLAAASGIAGVLSLTSGLSTNLVGVMVAVALLPPAATAGFLWGAGEMRLGMSALLLLGVNIVCVNLSGLAVFLARGMRPREWFERRLAKPYVLTGMLFWLLLLATLLGIIAVR